MNHADKKNEIYDAWKAAAPLTPEKALEIANAALDRHPKERAEFAAWFDKHKEIALRGINNA